MTNTDFTGSRSTATGNSFSPFKTRSRKAHSNAGKPHAWSFERRVMSKVLVARNGCWVWTGAAHNKSMGQRGYGQIKIVTKGIQKRWFAHRYVYTQVVGPIPAGMQIDHLCRNTMCVNPKHLQAVTPRANVRRSMSFWTKKKPLSVAPHDWRTCPCLDCLYARSWWVA